MADQWGCEAERLFEEDFKKKNCWDNIPAAAVRKWEREDGRKALYAFADKSTIVVDSEGVTWCANLADMLVRMGCGDGELIKWAKTQSNQPKDFKDYAAARLIVSRDDGEPNMDAVAALIRSCDMEIQSHNEDEVVTYITDLELVEWKTIEEAEAQILMAGEEGGVSIQWTFFNPVAESDSAGRSVEALIQAASGPPALKVVRD